MKRTNQRTSWTNEDENIIVNEIHFGIQHLASKLGRTKKAVKCRILKLRRDGQFDVTEQTVEGKTQDNIGDVINLSKKHIELMTQLNNVQEENIELKRWCTHILKLYKEGKMMDSDDFELYTLIFFVEDEEIEC